MRVMPIKVKNIYVLTGMAKSMLISYIYKL